MISAFAFALVTSFWGSIPPGPSNLAVFHTVLNKDTKSGVWMSFGACLPELPYTLLAILAVQYVSAFSKIELLFEIITAIILVLAGIYVTFFQKKQVDLNESVEEEKLTILPFWKGALIGAFNPMIFGFWLVTADVASKTGWLELSSYLSITGFVVGAVLGALLLLIFVALFTHNIKQKLTTEITVYLNKTIGVTFILLGVVQAYKFFTH